MDEKKAEDFIPRVQEILGKGYTVEKANLTGSLKAIKNDKVIFRIFQSMTREHNAFVVRLDERNYRGTAEKVSKELGLELVI